MTKTREFALGHFNRECLTIDVGFSLPSERVICWLERIIEWRGKPTQNAYIERFNRTVREEILDLHWFESVREAESIVTEWIWLYNKESPILRWVKYHQEGH